MQVPGSTADHQNFFNGDMGKEEEETTNGTTASSSLRPNFLDCAPPTNGDNVQYSSMTTQRKDDGTMLTTTTASKGRTILKEKISNETPTDFVDVDNSNNNMMQVFGDLISTICTTDDQRHLYKAMLNLEDLLSSERQSGGRSDIKHKQQIFLLMGGPLAVVTTMTKHCYNMAVQEWGLVTLTNAVAAQNNGAIQDVLVQVGGVRTILDAITTHASSRSIQQAGLTVLYYICANPQQQQQHVKKFDSAIVSVIVHVVETFANDEELVLLACQLLDHVSRRSIGSQQQQQVLIDAKVIERLSTILQTYRHKNNDIIKYAGRTMIRLVVTT